MRRNRNAFALALALVACACDNGGPDRQLAKEMEVIEEATESFANALLDMSVAVRNRDSKTVARFFAPLVQTNGIPGAAGQPETSGWIVQQHWIVSDQVSGITGTQLVAQLDRFLSGCTVEDARFKVANSTVSGQSVVAAVKWWLIARNPKGQRAWTRGRADAAATRDRGAWRLDRFVVKKLHTMTAVVDVFDEVAEPAGMAATARPVAARKDEPFAAYGTATADVDRDGLLDLFATGADGNHLYRNLGDGTFDDIAKQALVHQFPQTVTAPLFLDFDNDGDTDLFLSAIGTQVLLENRLVPDKKLVFWDVSNKRGVARPAIGFSAVATDVNGDGFPDIYVASYNRYGEVLPDSWDGASNGTPNLLFVSKGDGTYAEAAAQWGVADRRWTYAAGFADVDEDGKPDLYIANDFGGGNALYMHRGDKFVDEARSRGVVDGGYGMGVSFADYDNDGHLDLHVTRMSSTAGRRILSRLGGGKLPTKDRLERMAVGNALYRNNGEGHFQEVTAEVGPFSGGWAWGGGFIDIDNNGFEDLYTPNGFISGTSLKDT
ncbi:MAG: hypothetical protein CMJ85_05415 [Planctomycetes bacterium]|nr:hypothetical protein [Planctomycetota bacterium]